MNDCPECDGGVCHEVIEDYKVTTPEGEAFVVPNIPVWRCDKCHTQWLSPEAADAVDAFIAKATEQLTPQELQRFLEKYQLTQAEAGQILGLGEKTINRWLKGHQVISRSMGYYIRTLMNFPEAVPWLKSRGWRNIAPPPPERPSEYSMPAMR